MFPYELNDFFIIIIIKYSNIMLKYYNSLSYFKIK